MQEHTFESNKTIFALEKEIELLKLNAQKEEEEKMKVVFDCEKINMSLK